MVGLVAGVVTGIVAAASEQTEQSDEDENAADEDDPQGSEVAPVHGERAELLTEREAGDGDAHQPEHDGGPVRSPRAAGVRCGPAGGAAAGVLGPPPWAGR